ncbi:HNH endonuclease [Delftia sp. SD018]|uniref:HNH endonuclease signature motif containing protein n=1 Tax=Delftia sp. SD018 TaxID=2781389 RepID=UPI001A9679BE|nr:HNH endonuclease signature motif containing protein [Delftia sp. SD018]MBO1034239.1 HNH endonuclease [Delftia sp. SD018]
MTSEALTDIQLRSLLKYDPDTGQFERLVRMGRYQAGTQVGAKMRSGYIAIRINFKLYYAHRLAWLYVHGAWPPDQVDHINGARDDNRIANLRLADRFRNTQNLRSAKAGNKSGLLGVSPHQNRWRAFLHVHGKTHHLGLYNTPEEAHAAYVEAKRSMHEGNTL